MRVARSESVLYLDPTRCYIQTPSSLAIKTGGRASLTISSRRELKRWASRMAGTASIWVPISRVLCHPRPYYLRFREVGAIPPMDTVFSVATSPPRESRKYRLKRQDWELTWDSGSCSLDQWCPGCAWRTNGRRGRKRTVHLDYRMRVRQELLANMGGVGGQDCCRSCCSWKAGAQYVIRDMRSWLPFLMEVKSWSSPGSRCRPVVRVTKVP